MPRGGGGGGVGARFVQCVNNFGHEDCCINLVCIATLIWPALLLGVTLASYIGIYSTSTSTRSHFSIYLAQATLQFLVQNVL